MQFLRLKNSTDHGLAEAYAPADPRALISGILDIIQSLPVVGHEQVLLRIVHEVDRWEVVGLDADKAYAEIRN